MKNFLSMNFRLNRPKGFAGKSDKYLPRITQDLALLLRKTQKSLKYDTLRFSDGRTRELAQVLVEFAEDVHNDIGIWKSLEQCNFELFGTKLPLTLQPNEDISNHTINKYKIQYLLWVQYQLIEPQLILSPAHQDLAFLSEKISDFLNERFKNMPLGSSVKTFLEQPNHHGWDVKRKLIWLGKHSYLFRQCYHNYIDQNGGEPEKAIIDDFICQDTTCWSGLGVIDILASMLDITEKQRGDVRSWYERHAAFYKVLSINGPLVYMFNVINEQPYVVRAGENISNLFHEQHVYFGSLVPWDGEWYWSGVQQKFNTVSDKELREMKKTFLDKTSRIAYRYCKDLADKSREAVKDHYENFLKYHGKDLVVYSDGHLMSADLQKQYFIQNKSRLQNVPPSSVDYHRNKVPDLTTSFPTELLESNNGVGVFFNPDEGQEIMQEFYDIINGFKKKGVNLSEDEQNAIRGFISSNVISPRFVRKLIQEYGDKSIAAAFLIPDSVNNYFLDYFLRRYKGVFYRKRYPSISFVQTLK